MPADPYTLSSLEKILVVSLAGLITWETWRSWTGRDPSLATQPTVIVGAILIYYCLIGPLRAIAAGEWFDRGLNLRDTMVLAWLGSLIFFASVLIGYYALPRWRWRSRFTGVSLPVEQWRKLGSRLNWLGLTLYSVSAGPAVVTQLNPFRTSQSLSSLSASGIDIGPLGNYLSLCLNFLIPGTLLLFACWVRDRCNPASLVFWALAAVGLFTTSGFRWRLVVLLAPMALLWFLVRQRRPQLVFISVFAAGLIFLAGYVGLTRSYGAGLDITRIQGLETGEVFDAGFSETHIFLTTGGLIAQTPEVYPYVGLTPIISAATFFIPRQLWRNKPAGEYIGNATAELYGASMVGGAAALNIAEYYLMFGWLSLLVTSLALGVVLRSLYDWFLLNRCELSAQVIYAVSICFLYVVISRGYLPQVVSLLLFTVLPMALARGWILSQSRHNSASD